MGETAVRNLLGPLSAVEEKHAPPVLHLRGDVSLLRSGVRVCIIGTRKPTDAGVRAARTYAQLLVRTGATIVSGLAMGIDTVAHEAAIESGGRTIAVLGTPLNRVSPQRNAALQERIGREHLLVSQFPDNQPVTRSNFPQRARTMALLSDATIIVEAGETRGATHQGWEALRLARPLFILNAVVNAGYRWAQKMLDYGAMTLSDPSQLYEALPIRVDSASGEQAL